MNKTEFYAKIDFENSNLTRLVLGQGYFTALSRAQEDYFIKISKVLEVLFQVAMRKLVVNDELTFTPEFFQKIFFQYNLSLVGHFYKLQSKNHMASMVWLIERAQPKTFSELFSDEKTNHQNKTLDFGRPLWFTDEFCLKTRNEMEGLFGKNQILHQMNMGHFEYLSNLVYDADYFQQSINKKIVDMGLVRGDANRDLVIQI